MPGIEIVAEPLPALEETSRGYEPYGAALDLFYDRRPEVLLSGPAGTGKSRACLEKLFWLAEQYPGMRGLIARKTRRSITESALVTWEEKVVPPNHPCLRGATRNNRSSYKFPNKSEIIVGGLDDPLKIRSTEFDVVYVQEAIECDEDDWEELSGRLRNGKMPFEQIIADTNPSYPKHWLKKRCDSDKCRLYESRHEDNPTIWDRKKQKFTKAGERYIAKLDALTGVRKLRLRKGLWVQAEGIVYDDWDPSKNLITMAQAKELYRFDPAKCKSYWDIDFGYTNPFCWQWWLEDSDGRLLLYKEIYHTKRLVAVHCNTIRDLTKPFPKPSAVICDHDAEGRATVEKELGITTTPAIKGDNFGIQEVAARLKPASDGRPRLFINRDCLVEVDQALVEAKKPTCTVEEIEAWSWDTGHGMKKGDRPVKKDDHGMDGKRYFVGWRDRENRDLVWTNTKPTAKDQLEGSPSMGIPKVW